MVQITFDVAKTSRHEPRLLEQIAAQPNTYDVQSMTLQKFLMKGPG